MLIEKMGDEQLKVKVSTGQETRNWRPGTVQPRPRLSTECAPYALHFDCISSKRHVFQLRLDPPAKGAPIQEPGFPLS